MSFLYLLLSVFSLMCMARGKEIAMYSVVAMVLLPDRESQRTLPCGPWFLVRTQRRIWGLTCGKTSLLKNRRNTLQGRGGPSQEGLWCQNGKVRGFQDKAFLHFHLGGHGLTVLIDVCKLHNSLYCTCLCHNSVCYTQMYVCVKYLWTLKRLPAA